MRQRAAGFTLLELMVALAISSLLALAGAAALSMAMDFYRRGSGSSAEREDLRAAERTLAHEWQGRGRAVVSDGQTLEFDTVHPVTRRADSALTVARVRYACRPDPADLPQRLTLTHQVAPLPPPAAPTAPAFDAPRVLATGLRVCAFSFLSRPAPPLAGTQEQAPPPAPRWVTQWSAQQAAPDLMRLAMSGSRDEMPPVVFLSRAAVVRP